MEGVRSTSPYRYQSIKRAFTSLLSFQCLQRTSRFTNANTTSKLYFVVVTQTHPFLRADHAKNFLADIFSQAPISPSLPQLANLLCGSDYTKSKLLAGNFSTYLKITFLRGTGASQEFLLNLRRHVL